MRQLFLAIALVLASGSAMADRLVSAKNFSIEGDVIGGDTKPEACQAAKVHASLRTNWGEEVERYSRCDCAQNDNGRWICSVDASLAQTSKGDTPYRVVSAINFTMEHDVIGGDTKPEACQSAKVHASLKTRLGEAVERYSRCECARNDNGKWICTVDAKLARRP